MKIEHPFRTALVATLGVGLGIALIGAIGSLQTVLLYVGSALFVALGLDPIVSFLERRRLPRWAALLITFAGLVAAAVGILLMVVPIIVNQITQLVGVIEQFATDFAANPAGRIQDVRTWLTDTFPNLEVDTVFAYVQDWLQTLDVGQIGTTVASILLQSGVMIATGATGFLIVLILSIYFAASTPNMKASMYQLVPASRRERFVGLSEQITASVGYYVIGQVTLGLINGILSAIFLSIIGAPFPAVLAVVAFFFSLIPLVGTITGSAIIIVICLFASPSTALVALTYYVIYMQLEAYVLSPRIMSRAVSIPGAVVVIAALAGGTLLGLLGALIAIPVAASILIIYRQVVIPAQNER